MASLCVLGLRVIQHLFSSAHKGSSLVRVVCLQVGHIEDVVVDGAARGHKLGQR
jgi:hypothetical protein